MNASNLSDMVGGWFVGDFEPSVLRTSAFEVGVKRYRSGDVDVAHHHKVAREITVIINGRARMGDRDLVEGEIVVVEPGEVIRFEAITDVTLVVVKTPSVAGDKYVS